MTKVQHLPPHSFVPSMHDSPTIGLSTWAVIFHNDILFSQLPVVALRSQFMGHEFFLSERHVQAILRPRNLLDHLTKNVPSKTWPLYKRWVVEEEVLYIWILDSMTIGLVTCRFRASLNHNDDGQEKFIKLNSQR